MEKGSQSFDTELKQAENILPVQIKVIIPILKMLKGKLKGHHMFRGLN